MHKNKSTFYSLFHRNLTMKKVFLEGAFAHLPDMTMISHLHISLYFNVVYHLNEEKPSYHIKPL